MIKKILLHKDKEEKQKPMADSGTFGCSNARAIASQPKEPSFCLHYRENNVICDLIEND